MKTITKNVSVSDDTEIYVSSHTAHMTRPDGHWVQPEECQCTPNRIFQFHIKELNKDFCLVIPGCTAYINEHNGYIINAIDEFADHIGYKIIPETQVDSIIQGYCISPSEVYRDIDEELMLEPIIEYGFNRRYYVARDVVKAVKKVGFKEKCLICGERLCMNRDCKDTKNAIYSYDSQTDRLLNDGYVYIIKAKLKDQVKIGFSQNDNGSRLKEHKRSQWGETLELLAYIKGSREMETSIHYDLREFNVPNHSGRELFFYTPKVKKYIKNLISICEHSENEQKHLEMFNG